MAECCPKAVSRLCGGGQATVRPPARAAAAAPVVARRPGPGVSRSRRRDARAGRDGRSRSPVTFCASRSGWSMQAVSSGSIRWSRSLQKLDEVRTAARRGPGAAPRSPRSRAHLAHDRVRVRQRNHPGAGVRGAERDQRADAEVTAEPLHVVAGYQAAQAVPDDVDLLAARCARRSPLCAGRAARRRCGCRRSAASS